MSATKNELPLNVVKLFDTLCDVFPQGAINRNPLTKRLSFEIPCNKDRAFADAVEYLNHLLRSLGVRGKVARADRYFLLCDLKLSPKKAGLAVV